MERSTGRECIGGGVRGLEGWSGGGLGWSGAERRSGRLDAWREWGGAGSLGRGRFREWVSRAGTGSRVGEDPCLNAA